MTLMDADISRTRTSRQRLGAEQPQSKCEGPLKRRDAMSAEKTAGENILLEMRDSFLSHCEAETWGERLKAEG